MTDNEIIKALEKMRENLDDGYTTCLDYGGKRDMQVESDIHLYGLVIDLINRQKEKKETMQHYIDHLQAEIEMLKRQAKANDKYAEALKRGINVLGEKIKTAKAEAYKEFAENVQGEIDDAIHSNYNAKEERVTKSKKFGIPIDAEDSYLMYCDGKIHALSGINYYIDNLLKEMDGANND